MEERTITVLIFDYLVFLLLTHWKPVGYFRQKEPSKNKVPVMSDQVYIEQKAEHSTFLSEFNITGMQSPICFLN